MDGTPKNQVVERLRSAQNVLITVSNNPSVDQLSAAIGFTLLMNKLGKHATAVFSGQIPSTIEFLKPEDTLEQNTDSLRDFIIALDKSKADKLRYKVEENVVKIFITPYKTSLSEKDLEFSQGDFNVDVVVALGVDQREHIDQAIVNHGRILHDATVIGVMAGQNAVDLGNINWQEPAASSLCEMLVSVSEAFGSGLLDAQMSTAFLTGIVAETDRFSNDKTTPKVMTMAAQLMAAGANQQLISNKLDIPEPPKSDVPTDLPPPDEGEAASEGEIHLHEEPDKPPINPNAIDIDKEGTLRHAEELEALKEIHDVKVDAPEEKAEQPEQDQPADKEEYSQYVSKPPRTGGRLTANTELEDEDENVDPLSQALESNIPVFPTSAMDGLDEPLGPEISDDENLDEIEKSVNAHQIEPSDELTPDVDAARKAVEDAAKGFDPERPGPVEDLGAISLPELRDPADPMAPPPVPPPIPFPLPKMQDDKLPPQPSL
jgi:hypothetical protein